VEKRKKKNSENFLRIFRSLLSVLSGKVDKTSGSIKISGKEDSIQNYRKLVGFVPQDDVMHRSLTVKENILFCARTRLATSVTDKDKDRLANEVIKLLGNKKIWEFSYKLGLNRVRHSIIGNEEQRGVSGGERKRVNIGMELAAQPSVLFLDEVKFIFVNFLVTRKLADLRIRRYNNKRYYKLPSKNCESRSERNCSIASTKVTIYSIFGISYFFKI
jgi:ABC-type nitrate/sulfonate/bicarbonate transport system ATPase subunit